MRLTAAVVVIVVEKVGKRRRNEGREEEEEVAASVPPVAVAKSSMSGRKRTSSSYLPSRIATAATTATTATAAVAILCCCLLLIIFPPLCSSQSFNEVRWNEYVRKTEEQAVELAREVERAYEYRCNRTSLLDRCERSNYDHCLSSYYENPVCLGGESYSVPACGDVDTGSAWYDYSASTVFLPELLADGNNGNPTDPQVIETVCFTRELDDYFQATYDEERNSSWYEEYGVEPWAMYFGSHTGALRLYPARRSNECGTFDPRLRPWYVAASSGPKNVVMVLDFSSSMRGRRLELMKEAAKRVVDTLTVADRVAIVPFSTSPRNPIVDGTGYMYIATNDAKQQIWEHLNGLQADGKTNFMAAFKAAFSVLEKTIEQEILVECYTAILFFTDGRMTEPRGTYQEDVIEYVSEQIDYFSNDTGKPVMLFTHSISENEEDGDDDVAHQFPSALACSTRYGVWSKIASDDEIADSLMSYYRLFALGLGSDKNENFVAWVEPYRYATGGEVLGTTVSVPVYDRTKDPHLFLGVVGVDIALSTLENALSGGDGDGSATVEAIDRVVVRSGARCPVLNLTECKMESYRRQSVAGDLAMCNADNCTEDDLVQVEEQQCPIDDEEYPTELWINTDDAELTYEESVCCGEGYASRSSGRLSAKRTRRTALPIVSSFAAVAILASVVDSCY